MVAGKRTVFLMPVPRGALAKRANLESTHLGLSKLALFAMATVGGVLAAGCMGSDRVCLIREKSGAAGTCELFPNI